jgi:NADH:ubiquinone oxidoreductase subunit 3 (subunit A)
MDNSLLIPPIAFLILLATIVFLSYLFSKWAFRKTSPNEESKKAYSCGEEFSGHLIQPDYSQFFPFAFFFMVLHVVAMVIATVPVETIETFDMAMIYIIGAVTGLFILLRK